MEDLECTYNELMNSVIPLGDFCSDLNSALTFLSLEDSERQFLLALRDKYTKILNETEYELEDLRKRLDEDNI